MNDPVFFFTGVSLSQTTPTPAVSSTTPFVNVTTLTVTPMILSSTTPGCTAFNTSTCESCAPGSQYDNSKPSGSSRRVLAFLDGELPRHAALETPRFTVFISLQTPSCVHAALSLGSVCFPERACRAPKVFISPYPDNNSVGPATAATTQSTHAVPAYSLVIVAPVLSISLE